MKIVEEIVKRTYDDNGGWLPPSEAQPLVRCKDCRHKEESVSPSWEAWCNRLHCGCDLDWFCADGKRLTE